MFKSDAYWYISPRAFAALKEIFEKDDRRTWWPLDDSPSLATLQGKARDYANRYEMSRHSLFAKAGVRVREVRGVRDKRIGIITLPMEPASTAVQVTYANRKGVRRLLPA